MFLRITLSILLTCLLIASSAVGSLTPLNRSSRPPTFRVLHLNLYLSNDRHDDVVQLIRDERPDCFTLNELTPRWATALEVLVMGEHESLGKRSKLSRRVARIASCLWPEGTDLVQLADGVYRLRSECLHAGRTQVDEPEVGAAPERFVIHVGHRRARAVARKTGDAAIGIRTAHPERRRSNSVTQRCGGGVGEPYERGVADPPCGA